MGYQFPQGEATQPMPPEALPEGVEGSGVKLEKDEVNYRPSGSSQTNCGSCAHYLGDGVCELVAGTVSISGVSDAWKPRNPKGLMDLA